VADGTAKDTDRAAAAARAALAGWEALGGLERADYLTAIAYGLREQDRLLASMQLLCQAGDELPPATVEDSLERAFLHLADWTRTTEPGVLSVGTHGAYALIVPPGNPLQTVAWELASWLARGSTIVLKPSGFSSSVAVLLAQVAHDSGLPPGVFNLLLGDDKAAGLLGAHWDVQLPPKHPGNGVPA
jgi:aldehyde dehydrogenase (NAD+)